MILLVDKPEKFTSHDVVACIKRASGQRLKIGHTGTLDPMCTGLLPVLTGEDTRLVQFFPKKKEYVASLRFGLSTDTGDIWGTVLSQRQVAISKADFSRILSSFLGPLDQTPPMYSAVRVNGQRLYELARQGKAVARPSRKIEIFEIELKEQIGESEFSFRVVCSSGTYIRTLCEQIGQALEIPAVMSALRRTYSNGFSLRDALPLKVILSHAAEGTLKTVAWAAEDAFASLPSCIVPDDGLTYYRNGGVIACSRFSIPVLPEPLFRCYSSNGCFLGLGKRTPDGVGIKQAWKKEVADVCNCSREF